ncbi:transglycosylase domain-containing protein [Bacillus horti]|uniref:1A family penicillin-binding protein n=1 Tax=Caldalkalibacillus horti TaxID=77523 RepID=A0ABT9VVS9_9BACI|nr:PBP1A family penicillin-binding protein [Bacillus horti]MDQ0165088.1 1A family penicillin-binding protein [Bacillus horti]
MQVIRESKVVRLFRWIGRLSVIAIILLLLCAALAILGLLFLRSQPLPPSQVQETTTIYAADGEIMDTIHKGQNRVYVPIDDIPEYLIQATLAVEDQRFFEHFGIDVRRVGGALLSNIRSGQIVEGASTLTQQLARNLYLNHDRTVKRKLQEAMYTIQLELHLSKTEILERYLNQIYFGHSAYGVEAASQLFFGKRVSELSLAEAAMIVGVPKGPRYYSPYLNMENAVARQQLILSLMERQGFITSAEKEAALAEPLQFLSEEERLLNAPDIAPYFTDYVRQLAIHEYGIEEEFFNHGGLRIYTTLDAHMQQVAEESVERLLPQDRDLQGALLAIEPRTGHIKAMVGGKNYDASPFNRVFAERQPGSSIKPFLYYAALEQGLTPLTEMKSEATVFTYDEGRATYSPRNFNNSYPNDFITMEQAIASSDNIYAVKTLLYLGEQSLVDTLKRFGFERDFRPLPSLALGAQNVSLFEMVQGYSILANEGVKAEPIAILRIEDRNGNVIVQEGAVQQELVLDKADTFILTRMLRSVFEQGGTGFRVAPQLHRPVAGKTGSTDTDSWMIGYTPELVAGVWIGYDMNQLINHNNDGRLSAQIWAEFIEGALHDRLPSLYDVPDGVVGAYVNPNSGLLATEHCPVQKLMYFKQGTEPLEYCHEHLPDPDMAPVPLEDQPPSTIWQKLRQWWGG